MSEPENTNNQGLVPALDACPDSAPAQSYTRDPRYYYDCGDIVFLVGDVLFKLYKIMLLLHMDDQPNEFAQFTRSDIKQSLKGTSDIDPIVIWEVTPQQFRDFLFFILDTPANPEYVSLFMGADNTRNHNKVTFICYIGMAMLARYFGMSGIGYWSRSQLRQVLKSLTHFVNSEWDKYIILQAVDLASRCPNRLANEIGAFVWLALSTSAANNPIAYLPPLSSNLDTCVALFKDPNIRDTYPTLFGYVFTVILSLGHRSFVWTNWLTREDRIVLNAAQVHLISLRRETTLRLSWLSRPPSQNWGGFCTTCSMHMDNAWRASFARCGTLDSDVPLEDISRLVLLPSYRQIFADSIHSIPKPCEEDCYARALYKIDSGQTGVFFDMYSMYEHFVENG